ncbi:MAG: hypothetical protein ACOC1F_08540 [Myxococcota bacterium]
MRFHRASTFALALVLMVACGGDDHDDLTTPPNAPDASTANCTSPADCPTSLPVCDELAGTCVACLFATQCEGGETCEDKVCVEQTPCDSSLDCVDHAPRTICDTATSTCVECIQPSDCTGTADCVGNKCEPYVSCETSLDCPTGLVCASAIARCVECETEADCSGDDACIGNECKTLTPCASDNQCTPLGKLCDKSLGYCVDCVNNEQCPDAYHCAKGTCELDTCEAGMTVCQSNALVTCLASGAAWGKPEVCPSRTTCASAGGKASCQAWVCEPGLTVCKGEVLETCADDGLRVVSSVDCTDQGEHCSAGQCTDKNCTPGASFCEGNAVHKCNAAGTDSTVTDACGSGEYCDPSTVSCRAQLCVPGSPVCNGAVATTCNANGSGFVSGGTDCGALDQSCAAGECVAAPTTCGWDPSNGYYACGFQGSDPSGTHPITCPPDLQEGATCGTFDHIGCCDENGDVWYCASFFITREDCSSTPSSP